MDFGRLLADPIMPGAVVNSLFFLLEGTDVFLCIACSAMRALSVQKSFFFTFFGS